MDRLTKAQRSRLMSRIGCKGTGPEERISDALRGAGVGFLRNVKTLPGCPDIVLLAQRAAVFVHGCFWHGCRRHYRRPESNTDFWDGKLESNRRRDRRAARLLRSMGWQVVTIWECRLEASVPRLLRIAGPRGSGRGCSGS